MYTVYHAAFDRVITTLGKFDTREEAYDYIKEAGDGGDVKGIYIRPSLRMELIGE